MDSPHQSQHQTPGDPKTAADHRANVPTAPQPYSDPRLPHPAYSWRPDAPRYWTGSAHLPETPQNQPAARVRQQDARTSDPAANDSNLPSGPTDCAPASPHTCLQDPPPQPHPRAYYASKAAQQVSAPPTAPCGAAPWACHQPEYRLSLPAPPAPTTGPFHRSWGYAQIRTGAPARLSSHCLAAPRDHRTCDGDQHHPEQPKKRHRLAPENPRP